MQSSQEINWFAILVPSLIVGLFTIAVQILVAYKLSKVTESYKKDLSKELEDYKKNIGKELYVFQTRFSLLHQKKAEAIKDFYALLSESEFLLNTVSLPSYPYDSPDFNKRRRKQSLELYEKTLFFFTKNRIYFDEELCVKIDVILKEMSAFFGLLIDTESKNNPTKLNSYNMMYNKINTKIKPIRKELENTFRLMLEGESQDNQLNKKNEQ